jgi:hypothetical protein
MYTKFWFENILENGSLKDCERGRRIELMWKQIGKMGDEQHVSNGGLWYYGVELWCSSAREL